MTWSLHRLTRQLQNLITLSFFRNFRAVFRLTAYGPANILQPDGPVIRRPGGLFCIRLTAISRPQGNSLCFCTVAYFSLYIIQAINISRPLTDRDEICTQVWRGVSP